MQSGSYNWAKAWSCSTDWNLAQCQWGRELSCAKLFVPDDWTMLPMLYIPRTTPEGGVGFMCQSHFSFKLDTRETIKKFTIWISDCPCNFNLFYLLILLCSTDLLALQPTRSKKKKNHWWAPGDLLELTSTMSGRLILLGDFSVMLTPQWFRKCWTPGFWLFGPCLACERCNSLWWSFFGSCCVTWNRTLSAVMWGEFICIWPQCHSHCFTSGKAHPIRKQTTFWKFTSINIDRFQLAIESSRPCKISSERCG